MSAVSWINSEVNQRLRAAIRSSIEGELSGLNAVSPTVGAECHRTFVNDMDQLSILSTQRLRVWPEAKTWPKITQSGRLPIYGCRPFTFAAKRQ